MIKYRAICAVCGLTRLFYMNTGIMFFCAVTAFYQPEAVNRHEHQQNQLNNNQPKRGKR